MFNFQGSKIWSTFRRECSILHTYSMMCMSSNVAFNLENKGRLATSTKYMVTYAILIAFCMCLIMHLFGI